MKYFGIKCNRLQSRMRERLQCIVLIQQDTMQYDMYYANKCNIMESSSIAEQKSNLKFHVIMQRNMYIYCQVHYSCCFTSRYTISHHPDLKKYNGGGRGALRNIHLGPFVKFVGDPHYTFLCGFGQTTCCKQWVLTQGVISYIFSRGHFIHFLFLIGSLGYVRGVIHTFNIACP